MKKLGYRKIQIDKKAYYWKLEFYEKHTELLIQTKHSKNNKAKIILTDITDPRINFKESAHKEKIANQQNKITPSTIKYCIQKALENGWNVKKQIADFKLNITLSKN